MWFSTGIGVVLQITVRKIFTFKGPVLEQQYYSNGNVFFIERIIRKFCIFQSELLKGIVCNENQGGLGRWHTFDIGLGPWRSMFFCLEI
jgi:hypothetical protein